MLDSFGREIDYLRISVTDRCDMHCVYCMPDGMQKRLDHHAIIRYEELVRIVSIAARLGIRHVRLTGGEPLVRKGIPDLVGALKSVPGIDSVTMTTNGLLFSKEAARLKSAGLDGVNISIDSLDPLLEEKITGVRNCVPLVTSSIEAAINLSIPVKLNAVLLEKTKESIIPLTSYARQGIPVRFIELMPIGCGGLQAGLSAIELLEILSSAYPDIHETVDRIGCGPARYFQAEGLKAPVGVIDAVSHSFCRTCNRIRLTSTGTVKPCLCYGEEIDLLSPMRSGITDDALSAMIHDAIFSKPREHCFTFSDRISEKRTMSQIGG